MSKHCLGVIAMVALLGLAPGVKAQPSTFDGVYHGPSGGVSGNSFCGTTRFGYPIRVKGGVASMQTVSVGVMQGAVGPDGSVNIQAGQNVLSGQISGSHFSGTLSVRRCAFNLQYDRG